MPELPYYITTMRDVVNPESLYTQYGPHVMSGLKIAEDISVHLCHIKVSKKTKKIYLFYFIRAQHVLRYHHGIYVGDRGGAAGQPGGERGQDGLADSRHPAGHAADHRLL